MGSRTAGAQNPDPAMVNPDGRRMKSQGSEDRPRRDLQLEKRALALCALGFGDLNRVAGRRRPLPDRGPCVIDDLELVEGAGHGPQNRPTRTTTARRSGPSMFSLEDLVRLERLHVRGGRALGALLGVVRDLRALGKRLEAAA